MTNDGARSEGSGPERHWRPVDETSRDYLLYLRQEGRAPSYWIRGFRTAAGIVVATVHEDRSIEFHGEACRNLFGDWPD